MRRLVLVAIAVAALLALGPCRRASDPGPTPQRFPPIDQAKPERGDPPVVWVAGTLVALDDVHLAIKDGEGPRLRLERLAEGATGFFRLDRGAWAKLGDDEDGSLVGLDACVETLLDGRTFLALRVFLGASCGPAGPPS